MLLRIKEANIFTTLVAPGEHLQFGVRTSRQQLQSILDWTFDYPALNRTESKEYVSTTIFLIKEWRWLEDPVIDVNIFPVPPFRNGVCVLEVVE